MERSYIAFISYRHVKRDAAIAKQVHTLIENYIIPKSLRKDSKKLGVVFRDEEELPISSDLTTSICTALDASRYLIVICSPEMKESIWVSREIEYFLRNHDANNAFVILASGEPCDVFPTVLTHVLNKETGEYQDVEPLALDVRADSISASLRKVKSQIKKLYASMFGCSYDILIQREKNRRLKRLAALAILIVLLASSFIGMLFIKNRELSQKNDQLTEAIELSFKSESALLAEKSDSALSNGDVIEALRYASDALYSEDVDRPYYGPAERALLAAVDDLENRYPLLAKIELKHNAPVEAMAYSADGNTVYTIDSYGTVRSFNSATGDLRWNVKLDESSTDHYNLKDTNPKLWYDDENSLIVCYYDYLFSALDASSGQLYWQTETENTISSDICFDQDEKKLAYFESKYDSSQNDGTQSGYKYSFITISMLDGSIKHQIPLERLTSEHSSTFGSYWSPDLCGSFAGANRFIGTVFKAEEALFFTIDLSENTVIYTENQLLDNNARYIGTFFAKNDCALVLSTTHNHKAYQLQCFDVNTGKILWENIAEFESFIYTNVHCFIVPYRAGIMISSGNHMFVADYENGEILASKELENSIVYMHPQSDGMLAMILWDGTCLVGWWNQNGIYDSSFFSSSFSLPGESDIIVHNGGLIQTNFIDSTIDSFSCRLLSDGGGSVTYLSEDRNTAYVTFVMQNHTLFETIPVESRDSFPAESGEFADENPQGQVLTILPDRYNVIDTQDHSVVSVINDDFGRRLMDTKTYLTADAKNIIVCNSIGDIAFIDIDDTVSADGKSSTVRYIGDGLKIFGFRADVAEQTVDGRIIAARSNGQQLSYWIDGGEETLIPLPEDLHWSFEDTSNYYALLRVGENGLIVLSDLASGDTSQINHFAVYDLSDKEWKHIPDSAHGSCERPLAFGRYSKLFAVYDADRNIRIYDWDAGKQVHSINVGLPDVSIAEIGTLLEDRYVYVLTLDGRFMIYSTESYESVFLTTITKFNSSYGFSYWLDQENARLYIHTNYESLCIDTQTWEKLFSKNTDFKFYSVVQNEIYTVAHDPETSSDILLAIPVPNTAELVDLVRNYLY